MEKFKLSKDVYVETVAIRIKEVDEMINFYKNVLGFVLKLEENNLSIFGSLKKDSRLLILEETEVENELMKSNENSICFSLLIPTLEEFSSLLRRITVHNYPIMGAVQLGSRKSIFLSDPEGNRIEVSYEEGIESPVREKEELDIADLIKNSKVLYSSLSSGVRLDRVQLFVNDVAEHFQFYQDMLGMIPQQDRTDKLTLDNHNFSIHLEKSEIMKPQKSEDEALGIDFFVLNVDHEDEMVRLKNHLEEHEQDFFIDNKKTILTIYDPSNIEWWFVRN
ncbi:VOC family protein [Enterococcus termitis]|uniref:VOC domain-containing protein n=1 Tax=Enterococcus termitis TaxID=332950 RepID=A0A1E5GIH4_9ENTE|nr:VOC family protein [Enterococcus termitis]OEG12395.1 hypothetical protein BCR25_07605 [Enterococcus termitis]OJG98773.1 hypothetical protein RV18_GL002635 [Enterococcus termitis]